MITRKAYFLWEGLTRHLAWATLGLCLIPYGVLLLNLRLDLHGDAAVASIPSPKLFVALALLGAVLPAVGAFTIVYRLVQDRERFQLRLLLQAYFCLILIFASGYALLQASSATPSFSGMIAVWAEARPATLAEHVAALHMLFFDALYLSVVTITTVGFGDLLPLSVGAKILTAIESLVGLGFMGLVLGHYFSVCTRCSPLSADDPAKRQEHHL